MLIDCKSYVKSEEQICENSRSRHLAGRIATGSAGFRGDTKGRSAKTRDLAIWPAASPRDPMVSVAIPKADLRKPAISPFGRPHRPGIRRFPWRYQRQICENPRSRHLTGRVAPGSDGFRGDTKGRSAKTRDLAIWPATSPRDSLVSVAIPKADLRKPAISPFDRPHRPGIRWFPWRYRKQICENPRSHHLAGRVAPGFDGFRGDTESRSAKTPDLAIWPAVSPRDSMIFQTIPLPAIEP